MTAEDGDGSVCFTPGCGNAATKFYVVEGGTRFLCAACDYCGVQIVMQCPAGISVEPVSFEAFAVEQVMDETRGTSYLAFTGGGHSTGNRLPGHEADGPGAEVGVLGDGPPQDGADVLVPALPADADSGRLREPA